MPLDSPAQGSAMARRGPDRLAVLIANARDSVPEGDPRRALLRRAESMARRAAAVIRAQASRINELESLVETDPLTGLLNRRGLLRRLVERLAEAARHGEPGVVMFCDMDGLKSINDRFGHAAGDLAIRTAAAAIRGCVRATDTVARIGGDEFAILMSRIDAERGLLLASRLSAAIRRLDLEWNGERAPLGLSVGIAAFSGGEDPEALLARADHAMYAEKRSARRVAA